MTDMVMMPGLDYQAICDAVRAKTGGSDLLKSGELAALIGGISGGEAPAEVPTINGRTFRTGTFSFASNFTSGTKTISFEDIGKPYAAFVFPTNMAAGTDGSAATSVLLKFFVHIEGFGSPQYLGGSVLKLSGATGGCVFGNPGTNSTNGVTVTSTSLTFYGISSYPMKAGVEYMWIVIGEEV